MDTFYLVIVLAAILWGGGHLVTLLYIVMTDRQPARWVLRLYPWFRD